VAAKESVFEKKAIKILRSLPHSYWPDKSPSGSIRGLPDRIGCVNGRYVALEFKRSMKDAMKHCERLPLQLHTLNQIDAANGYAVLCCPENWHIVLAHVKEMAGVK
jgi:hypothetical protein